MLRKVQVFPDMLHGPPFGIKTLENTCGKDDNPLPPDTTPSAPSLYASSSLSFECVRGIVSNPAALESNSVKVSDRVNTYLDKQAMLIPNWEPLLLGLELAILYQLG